MFIDSNHYLITVEYIIFITLAVLTILEMRKTKIEVFKARAFLDKNFLIMNFGLIIIAGSFFAVHEFIEMSIENGLINYSYHILNEGIENVVIILLIFWMYCWLKLVRGKSVARFF
jgi:hypothetical protein